jgi:hypothetical protein
MLLCLISGEMGSPTTEAAFRWLDVLEKEFDTAYVHVENGIGKATAINAFTREKIKMRRACFVCFFPFWLKVLNFCEL